MMKKGESKKKKVSRDKLVACSFCGTRRIIGNDILAGPCGEAICTDCAKKVVRMFSSGDASPNCSPMPRIMPGFWKKLAALTPGKIKAELDKCVIGQEEAKKVLSVAVYNHYRRIAAAYNPVALDDEELKDVAIEKSNIILAGRRGAARRCSPRLSPRCWTSRLRLRTQRPLPRRGTLARMSRTSSGICG